MNAPSAPPALVAAESNQKRRSGVGRFSRSASAARMWPGDIATALDALAMTGGRPAATIAGKVISVAPPASALMTPPSAPAPASSAAMLQSILAPFG
ncbi:hypothetical protein G6F65_022057 [Rhizopus arrhizus]|nr:hypothetical protein G6F65_022057 [Rhizopus arrhizus]